MPLKWEALRGEIGVWTDDAHKIMTDTLLLARFARPKPGERCADLGAGCGAIPLLWCAEGDPASVLAVEIQPEAAALMEKSVEQSGLKEKVRVIPGDLREYRQLLPCQALDLISCNPPYYPLGAGLWGEDPARIEARHEESLRLEDLARAALWGLRWGGRLCLCLPVERLAEAMELFRRERLEPKRLQLVQSGPEKAPYLFLLECKYGGKTGLTVEKNLMPEGGRAYGG